MAIGDDAAAAGFPLVPESGEDGKVKYGAREINRTRDLIAQRTSTVQPINKGGTGATTAAAARTALGVPALSHSHSAANITSGTLAIARGGTGGTTAVAARSALGASAEGHTHAWSAITSKPSTFAPSAHTHSYDSLTGRPSSFPPSSHNHDQLVSGSRRLGISSDVGGEIGWTTGANVAFFRNFFLPEIAVVTSSYRAMYINGDNRVGVTPSARKYKKDIQPKAYSLEAATALEVVNYRLRSDVYGSADAPVEVGVIAEQLIDAGLSEYVIYGHDGEPESVAYERLALIALGALREVETRLKALEEA